MNSTKANFHILKSYLVGYARRLISYLTLKENNYGVAINSLTKEFLAVPFIILEIFKQIIPSALNYDHYFVTVKHYLPEVKADLSELRTSYDMDFF